MDVEKSSKNASESAKLCGVKEREKGGFCFQKYSKDEISEFFHGLVYAPSHFEISDISKWRRKFRYFGVIFFGLRIGLMYTLCAQNFLFLLH
jgi:hypothetical protein